RSPSASAARPGGATAPRTTIAGWRSTRPIAAGSSGSPATPRRPPDPPWRHPVCRRGRDIAPIEGLRHPQPAIRTTTMPGPCVLSVGQCSLDHGSISRFLQKTLDAQVDAVASADQALGALRHAPSPFDRVFDRGGSGLDLIRTIRQDASLAEVPVMLVSNLPDAQQQAVEAGALPGFGKDDLGDEAVSRRIREAIDSCGGF